MARGSGLTDAAQVLFDSANLRLRFLQVNRQDEALRRRAHGSTSQRSIRKTIDPPIYTLRCDIPAPRPPGSSIFHDLSLQSRNPPKQLEVEHGNSIFKRRTAADHPAPTVARNDSAGRQHHL